MLNVEPCLFVCLLHLHGLRTAIGCITNTRYSRRLIDSLCVIALPSYGCSGLAWFASFGFCSVSAPLLLCYCEYA